MAGPNELQGHYNSSVGILDADKFFKIIFVDMWPIIWRVITARYKTWLPLITLPCGIVVGLIGYNLESILSDKYTPSINSAKEQRAERLLEENVEVESIKEKKFVPKTIFEKNLSPSLLEEDDRPQKYKAKG